MDHFDLFLKWGCDFFFPVRFANHRYAGLSGNMPFRCLINSHLLFSSCFVTLIAMIIDYFNGMSLDLIWVVLCFSV